MEINFNHISDSRSNATTSPAFTPTPGRGLGRGGGISANVQNRLKIPNKATPRQKTVSDMFSTDLSSPVITDSALAQLHVPTTTTNQISPAVTQADLAQPSSNYHGSAQPPPAVTTPVAAPVTPAHNPTPRSTRVFIGPTTVIPNPVIPNSDTLAEETLPDALEPVIHDVDVSMTERENVHTPIRTYNMSDVYHGPEAPPGIAPFPHRDYVQRYTWKVNAPKSDNPVLSYATAIQEVWDAIRTADPSLVIYPWAEKDGTDPSEALSNPVRMPTTTGAIKKYFANCRPRADGGDYYLSVRMGTEISPSELRREATVFFGLDANKNRVALWHRSLQDETPVEIGWLLGSTPFMSTDRLVAEILFRSKGLVQIGCRWKMIALETYVANMPENQRFKALHIEVRGSQHQAALKYLGELFSASRSSDVVFGTPMRLIPLLKSLSNKDQVIKASRIRERQGGFLHQLKNTRVYTLNNLDYRSARMDFHSMRDVILSIKRRDDPSKQLFVSCDAQVWDNSVVLTFLQPANTEAYAVAQNLLAYLRFTCIPKYTKALNAGFSAEEVERSKDSVWDKALQCVVTQADLQLQSIEEEYDGDFLGHDTAIQAQFLMELEEIPRAGQSTRVRNDDDSTAISSFRSSKKARTSTKPRETASVRSPLTTTRRANGTLVGPTTQTICSDVSMESRMSSMESRMDEMHHMLRAIFQSNQRQEQAQASTPIQGESGAGCTK